MQRATRAGRTVELCRARDTRELEDRLVASRRGGARSPDRIAVLATDDHLWVLHASAALGTAEYRRVDPAPHEDRHGAPASRWELVHGFEFACRHGDRACIDAFARRDGWSANVAEDGADRAFEITTRLAPAGARFAVVSLDPTTMETTPTPDVRACAGIIGGVLTPALQAGEPPATLDVDPRDWPSVGG